MIEVVWQAGDRESSKYGKLENGKSVYMQKTDAQIFIDAGMAKKKEAEPVKAKTEASKGDK